MRQIGKRSQNAQDVVWQQQLKRAKHLFRPTERESVGATESIGWQARLSRGQRHEGKKAGRGADPFAAF